MLSGAVTGPATTDDPTKAAVFAATDSHHGGRLTILVLNRNLTATVTARIDVHPGPGATKWKRAAVYAFDGSSPEIRPGGRVDVKDDAIVYRLPPLSATLFVCEGSSARAR